MDKHGDGVVVMIGVFKLLKAALLIVLGVGGLLALTRELVHTAARGITWLGVFPGRHMLARTVGRLWSLDPRTGQELGGLALGYGAVFAVEGIGLLRKKRWAEWLTVAVTASFIPFEIYELVAHFGAGKTVALVLNIAIVIYLAVRRFHDRGRARTSWAAVTRWLRRLRASRIRFGD
jgi:uncharacterized membrane protein (DUF2068 family)